LDSLPLEGATSILLAGDRLVAFAWGGYGVMPVEDGPAVDRAPERMPMMRAPSGTVVTVVDVSRPEALTVVAEQELESSYVSARLVDGVVQLVLTAPSPGLAYVQPTTEAAVARATAANREVIEASTLEEWLPGDGSVDCATTYRPVEGGSGTGLV